jgi:hypothetical protein
VADFRVGCDAGALAKQLRTSKDPRIKYIIWNRRIANHAAVGQAAAWEWRRYGGSNPHDHHFHLSVKSDKASYDSDSPWLVPKANEVPTPPPASDKAAPPAPQAVASAPAAATPCDNLMRDIVNTAYRNVADAMEVISQVGLDKLNVKTENPND